MTVRRTCPACWTSYVAEVQCGRYYVTCPNCHQNNIVTNKDAEVGRCRFCFCYIDDHSFNMEKGSKEFGGCEVLLGRSR